MKRTSPKALTALLAVAAVGLAACGDAGGITTTIPEPSFEAAVILNSVDNSLSVIPLDAAEGEAFTVGLGPAGSPVTMAVREDLVAVPLGSVVPAVVIVDLDARAVARTIALPEGSGATGVAFLNDSLVVVGNPDLGSVSVVNVRRGTVAAPVPVGGYPHRVVAANDTVWVLNAHLGPDFSPTRTGTVEVLTGTPLARVRTIDLSGQNPSAAVLEGSRLWIVNSGTFASASGSISEVSRAGTETRHVTGFGFFPGDLDRLPDGSLAVSSYAPGAAVWNPASGAFARQSDVPFVDGSAGIAALGTAPDGTVWALEGVCQGPARAFVLEGAGLQRVRTVTVGSCPIDVAFAEVPE